MFKYQTTMLWSNSEITHSGHNKALDAQRLGMLRRETGMLAPVADGTEETLVLEAYTVTNTTDDKVVREWVR